MQNNIDLAWRDGDPNRTKGCLGCSPDADPDLADDDHLRRCVYYIGARA